jgi:hypothetical protein
VGRVRTASEINLIRASAWALSQSGMVGNHLARLLEKEGQREKAGHMYGLAYAAGGADAEASRRV